MDSIKASVNVFGINADSQQSQNILVKHWGLIASVAISLGAYGGLIGLHLREANLNNASAPYTLAWYALAFVAYLGAVIWVERQGGVSQKIIK